MLRTTTVYVDQPEQNRTLVIKITYGWTFDTISVVASALRSLSESEKSP